MKVSLSPETALRLLRLLPEHVDIVLEAPCPTWAETASLRKRCRVPLYIDELLQQDADLITAISEDLADGINLKISKAGGLTHARRQRDMALAAGLPISVQDTVGSDIAFAAIAHLGATIPEKYLRCVLDTRGMVALQTAQFDAPIVDGGVLVPDKPGLGITVNKELFTTPVAIWE